MSSLTFHKLNQLPQTYDPNCVYMVVKADTPYFDLYVTNLDGTSIRQIASAGDSFSTFVIKSATQPQLPSEFAFWENTTTGDLYYQKTKDGLVSWDNLSEEPPLTGTHDISITGNAATATKLKTARTINGVLFDGTGNIIINAEDATPRIAVSEKGVANGVATLGNDGKVPASQLPSFTDDYLEYNNVASFPANGEPGKIYLAKDTNRIYRTDGTTYTKITSGEVSSVSGKVGDVTLTKADVDLFNVDNTSDANKPVSTAQQAALNLKANLVSPTFTGTPAAPTAVTSTDTTQLATTAFVQAVNKAGTGISAEAAKLTTARTINGVAFDGTANITINATDSTPRIASSEKGVANGVATLDGNGQVPANQLPSYVDDVLEYENLAAFPATGTSGKIYVALDTNKTYRWSGSTYTQITSGAVDSVAGKTGVVTLVKADVGLSNVNNTSDLDKPVSTATATALALKADLNSPALTGTPTAPTPASEDSSTKIATTAFVNSVVLGGAAPSTHVGSGGTAHALVTTSTAGFMSATDKTKLDGIAKGANNYTLTPATTTTLGGIKVSTGLSADAAGATSVSYGSTAGTSVQGNDTRVTADQAASTASIRTIGTGSLQAAAGNHTHAGVYQPLDADLTAIAALVGTTGILKKTAADTWSLDTTAYSTLTLGSSAGVALASTGSAGTSTTAAKSDHVHPFPTAANVGAEPTITAGTTSQFWRGDKTWVGLTKTDVGLGNVDNTSDLSKPVSTATQTALDAKAPLASPTLTGVPAAPTAAVGTNTTQLATTAFVNAEIANDAAPISHVGAGGTAHAVATTSVHGFMSATDKTKLDGIAEGANNYTLPVSKSTVLGGVKVSTGLSVDVNGVTTVSYGATAGTAVQGNDTRVTADQAAATASIRTLGTGALQAAPGNHTHAAQTTITGNAGSATKLQTARTINGVSFDGSANITINAVDSTARIPASEKGAANGVATLGADGKVPSGQLPSYVDDVLEFTNLAGFPVTGETGKIYVALDTNKAYRWSGSAYVYITSGAVDSVAGKTGVVTLVKGDVGLGNVDNTSDANKPISTATQSALDAKAPLASPSLTGTPTAPTALVGTSSLQLATTAFVNAEIANDAAPISHVGATGTAHGTATASVDGFMSAADKAKLDGISTGANSFSLTPATTTNLGGIKIGTGLTADASGVTSVTYGSAAGSAVQGNDTRVTADQAAATASIRTIGTGALQAAAGNHTHAGVYQPLDADLTSIAGLAGTTGLLKKTAADTWSLDTTAYSTLTLGSTVGASLASSGSAGVATTAAKSDHVHPYPTAANVGAESTITAGNNTQFWRGDKTWVGLDLTYLSDSHVKKNARVATTSAFTVSMTGNVITNTGTLAALVVDGVTVAVNDRVLVKNQVTAAQNGIYYVSNVGSASVAWTLTRTSDADTSAKIGGSVVAINEGSVNGGLRFDTDFKATDILNTISITWNRVLDVGMAATATPNVPGTANVGTSEKYAREDHVHSIQTTISGNAGTASKLETARNIQLSGAVSGTASFDGSANISITTTATAATTSAAGIVQLSTATNSTSTTLAATPLAVKSAYDLAARVLDEMIEPFLLMGV